ncbi:hypothetical protein AB4672_21870 [Bacillus paralicheniformis]|uniref:hypothetical protein n=1 Tax=Bacillus paralicheniformis TaxID=1648923 RepID=UPI0034D256C0
MKRDFNDPELIKDAERLGIKITINSSEPGVFVNVNGERSSIDIEDLYSETNDNTIDVNSKFNDKKQKGGF